MRAIYGDLGSATSLSTGLIFVVYEIFLIGFILLVNISFFFLENNNIFLINIFFPINNSQYLE